MPRSAFLLPALALIILAGGCVTPLHSRIPDPDSYHRRVDQDVVRYVERMDRELRLDRSQERRIARLLESRTYHLLDRTRPASYPSVYPFPRGDRRGSRAAQRAWWGDADRHIMRVLTRRQADAYFDLIRSGRLHDQRDRRDRDPRDGRGRRPTRRHG